MAGGAIRVQGLREFQRACRHSTAEVKAELPKRLKRAAEPVRVDAERRAGSEIRNISGGWQGMKAGSKSASAVYIAPKRRRAGGSGRANLGRLLMQKMLAARAAKQDEVIREFEDMLDDLVDGF